jgi:hypothetical protein
VKIDRLTVASDDHQIAWQLAAIDIFFEVIGNAIQASRTQA